MTDLLLTLVNWITWAVWGGIALAALAFASKDWGKDED